MSNSSISTLMGPSGPQGPDAPDGTSGPLGPTGNTGPTGSGASGASGTSGCDYSVIKSKDGSTFVIGPMRGPDGISGTPNLIINNVGAGSNLFKDISGATAYFRTFRSSGDITLTETPENLIITAPLGSGIASQVVGPTGSLLYYAGTTFLQGADDTFFAEGTGPEENSLQVVFNDFRELVKRHDPLENTPVSISLAEANNHYIVGSNGFSINEITVNTNGFTALSGDGVTFGESMNVTFIMKNAGLADEESPFDESKFQFVPVGPTFSASGTDIVNCISVNNGNTWHCFIAGKDYSITFDGILKIGSCCTVTPGEEDPLACDDYILEADCTGTFKNNVTCSSDPCATVFGACCVNRSCYQFSEDKCALVAGNFFINQQCSEFTCPGPCEELGCCCLGNAGSVTSNGTICADLGGIFNDDMTCEEFANEDLDPCEELTRGACCLSTECLFHKTPSECQTEGGVHMGPQTTCQTVDCCSGQAIPLGSCCCSDGSCNDMVTQSLCTGSSCVWSQGLGCESCATVLNCNCTQEGDNIPEGFRKWKLWIKDIFATAPDTDDLKLLGQFVPTDDIRGATGCDRLSDGMHNTYYEDYGNVDHNPETEAIPYAHSLSVNEPAESKFYVPSLNEMSFIALTNKNNFNILLSDTFPNVPYWTSTRKNGRRFYTVNEDGYAVDYSMSNEGAENQGKRAIIVQREMIATGNNPNVDPIGFYDAENERTFAGVFSAGCSLIITNYRGSIWDLPTYACSDSLELGTCCTNDDCNITNEYNCTDNGGSYNGDEVDPDCDPSPCAGRPLETNNCVRAGASPSFAASETFCADGLPDQLYYYAGQVNLDGTPTNTSTYDPRGYKIANDNYNIDPIHIQAGGDLTQGYCVGHDEAFTCTTDRNILSPTAIGSPTLLAYCNSTEIYGTGYSCTPSVCGEVSSDYDRTIDDCLSANSTALCGKAIDPSVIQFLNTLEDTTCSTIPWPIDDEWKYPCGDNSENCNTRIKLFDNSIQNGWVQSTTEVTTVFACEPCLNSFCAYATSVDDTYVSCCKPDGTWSAVCANLYNSYLQSVYYNECNTPDSPNPFCGNDVVWSSIVAPTPEIGTYGAIDRANFAASSDECKSRIQALRQTSTLSQNCSVIIGTPEFRQLNYVDFSAKQKHPKLVDGDIGVRDVPIGLEFKFLPVICNNNANCIAGSNDKFAEFTPSRYTSLLYGIDLGLNTNESLIGNTNNNLGLCYDGTCVDTLTNQSGNASTRVNTILDMNPVLEVRNQQSGLLVTNCQNRIYCNDTDTNGCSVCGDLEDLVETPDAIDFGCWNCETGNCETRSVCNSNEVYTTSCSDADPCPTGRCCDNGRCLGEEFKSVDCQSSGQVWEQDGECDPGVCDCLGESFGNCCTNGVWSYTCENLCGGAWVVGPEDPTTVCVPNGCCYQIENVNGVLNEVTSTTTQIDCVGAGDENGILFSRWTEGNNCLTPTGRICDGTTCSVINIIDSFSPTSGGAYEQDDTFVLDGQCSNEPCANQPIPCCCVGVIPTNEDIEGTILCNNTDDATSCIPFFQNVVGHTQFTDARITGLCPAVCDKTNPVGNFGYCCYSPDDTDETRKCKWPVGQWHCNNILHQGPGDASWGTNSSICDDCSPPPGLKKCCFNTFGQGGSSPECVYVETGNCTKAYLESANGCAKIGVLGGSLGPQESGNAPDGSVACVDCITNDCCFCAFPDATVDGYVCTNGEPTDCPNEDTQVRLIVGDISPLGDCAPDIRIELCGVWDQDEGYVCRDFSALFGISINNPNGVSVDLSRFNLTSGNNYQFVLVLTNCAGENRIEVGTGTFTYTDTCTIGGRPNFGGLIGGTEGCLQVN